MIAHLITTSRLLLAAGFAACAALLAADGVGLGVAALLIGLAIAEELTDVFDGVVARRLGTAGRVGGIYDPLVDSLARLAIYFSMALLGWITVAVPLVMTFRDIVVAYTRIVQALTGGRTSARMSGKVKAVVQGSAAPVIVALVCCPFGFPTDLAEALRGVVAGLVILVTAWSLADYVRGALPQLKRLEDA